MTGASTLAGADARGRRNAASPLPRGAGAALLDAGELLRERVVLARQASATLAGAVTTCCAVSLATRDAVQHTRAQWQAWREGLAALRRRTDPGERGIVRVCMDCEVVCFTPSGGDRDAEEWFTPPAWIREQFRGVWHGPALSHGICPRCAPRLDAELEREFGPEAATAELAATPHTDGARALLDALADVEAAAAEVLARTAAADRIAALDRALAAAVERMTASTPPSELKALREVLHALIHQLGAGAAPHHARAGRAPHAGRLRPPLRHR
jgi:hypothetical protein